MLLIILTGSGLYATHSKLMYYYMAVQYVETIDWHVP